MKSKLRPLLLVAALLPAASFSAPVLLNGTFADTTGAPWYTTGGVQLDTSTLSSVALVGFNSVFSGTAGSVRQDFTTVGDGTLTYAFSLSRSEAFGSFNDVALTFSLTVDGVVIDSTLPAWGNPSGIHPTAVSTWTDYTGSVALGAGAHVFAFNFSRGDSGFGRAPFFEIERVTGDFTATSTPPPASVPEGGASWSLMAAGCVVLGAMRWGRGPKRGKLCTRLPVRLNGPGSGAAAHDRRPGRGPENGG